MKTKLLTVLAACLFIFACQTESIDQQQENGLDSTEEALKRKNKIKPESEENAKCEECKVIDADRAAQTHQPTANFWWAPSLNGGPYYNTASSYFSSIDEHSLTFTECDDNTARITGTTSNGSCVVTVDVYLKDKRTWLEWKGIGGSHKKEGVAGSASISEKMHFYVIDGDKSTISASGDCIEEGTFKLIQRPDISSNPSYGTHIGPGGANFDEDLDAIGLSTWGWLLDQHTLERKYVIDFNFVIACEEPPLSGCETAFAKGWSEDDSDCFLEDGFNRWGWSIGPLAEGEYTYDIYAGAGQCVTSKGTLVGTATVNYKNGEASVTYNIDDQYSVTETHTYIGTSEYPTMKNGKETVAPGQYYIEDDLSGGIYVIAHAVVCGD